MYEHRWNRERLIEYAKSCGFEVLDGVPQKGESYIAGRNTEPQLLTCEEVHERGWIRSIENAYPYDIQECVRVKLP